MSESDLDEFAEKLRQLELSGPSAALDGRMEKLIEAPWAIQTRPRHAIALHWAVAAALMMGALGAFLGNKLSTVAPPAAKSPTLLQPALTNNVQIIYDNTSGHNPFDLTMVSNDDFEQKEIQP